MNAIGYPGRIIPAIIADRYLGPVNTLIPAALLSGIVMGTWMAVDKLQGEWAFTIVYGFFSSGVMGLVPSALSSLTDDLSKLGIRMGMAFTILSLPALSGSPIAGKLVQNKNGSFEAAQTFGCVVFIVGTLFLIGSRVSRHGLRLAKI
ncbi:membrane protein [Malassezia pachydermatis]